jgi:hypothetical protein
MLKVACSNRIALSGTAVIWLLFFVAGMFISFKQPAPEYKEIKITLTAAPAEEKKEPEKIAIPAAAESMTAKQTALPESSVKQSAPAEPVRKSAVPAGTGRRTVKTENIKPAPERKATENKPAAKTDTALSPAPRKIISSQPLKKSVDQLMAEQGGSTPKRDSGWDDRIFPAQTVSSSQQPAAAVSGSPERKLDDAAALSGTAAAAGNRTAAVASENTARPQKNSSGSAAAETLGALGKISAVAYSSSSGNGIGSSAVINSAQSSGGNVSIQMSDGSARRLLEPARPVIVISDKNAQLIDSSRTVTIQFSVLPGGNVPLSGIEITPSSALPIPVQLEIRSQIASWRFEPAETKGIARFEYNIIKK